MSTDPSIPKGKERNVDGTAPSECVCSFVLQGIPGEEGEMQENKILAGTWRAGIDVPLFLRKKKRLKKKADRPRESRVQAARVRERRHYYYQRDLTVV